MVLFQEQGHATQQDLRVPFQERDRAAEPPEGEGFNLKGKDLISRDPLDPMGLRGKDLILLPRPIPTQNPRLGVT